MEQSPRHQQDYVSSKMSFFLYVKGVKQKSKQAIYRFRNLISALVLLLIVHFIINIWSLHPAIAFIGWSTDTELFVAGAVDEAYQDYFVRGDKIIAINDVPVMRDGRLFSQPLASAYEFTLERGTVITRQVVPTLSFPFFTNWRWTISTLAILFWLSGAIIVYFSSSNRYQALPIGFAFQIMGAGLPSHALTVNGLPGAWLLGYSLVFLFPLTVIFLSCYPRTEPLKLHEKIALYTFGALGVGMMLISAVEYLWLFPATAIGDLTGLRPVNILGWLMVGAIFVGVGILLRRVFGSRQGSYERQQLIIMLVFFLLAIGPSIVYSSVDLNQTTCSNSCFPSSIIFSFLALAPFGYFCVLYRNRFVHVNTLASRVLSIISILLVMTLIYYSLLASWSILFPQSSFAIQGMLFVGIIAATPFAERFLSRYLNILFLGQPTLSEADFREITEEISFSPSEETIAALLERVANKLQLSQLAILYNDPQDTPLPTADSCHMQIIQSNGNQPKQNQYSKSRLPAWVHTSLPIKFRDASIGLLLLPKPLDSHYSVQQMREFEALVGIFAFGLAITELIDINVNISNKLLLDRELQRRQIATEIHNMPLQSLGVAINKLQKKQDANLQEIEATLQKSSRALRQIINGLSLAAIDESLEWMLRYIGETFYEENDLEIQIDYQLKHSPMLSEKTRHAICYIVTEALNNARKHAHASHIGIEVWQDEQLVIVVWDDGRGNIPNFTFSELLRRKHFGLSDMARWATIAGGDLSVVENGRTNVVFTMPSDALAAT